MKNSNILIPHNTRIEKSSYLITDRVPIKNRFVLPVDSAVEIKDEKKDITTSNITTSSRYLLNSELFPSRREV